MPSPLPALAAKTHRRFAPAPGVAAEAVTSATEFGTGVPGYERESLSVLPPAEWEKVREQFTFDAWTAKARAAPTKPTERR